MDAHKDRRGFLKGAAALATAAAGSPSLLLAGEADDPPIIDTHQHLWDRSRFRLPWLAGNATLDRDFLMADYLKAADGLGIVKTIYMEVDVDPAQQADEASYILDLARSGTTPMVAAIISGRPAGDGFAAYLDKFRDRKELKGVRQVLHSSATPAGYCLDPKFVAGIRGLGERGLSFDLCMRAKEIRDASKLAGLCPDTAFVLDHCGNPTVGGDLDAWKADIDAIAKRPNVACKVSGFIASAEGKDWKVDELAPIVNHVLDAFGPDRVAFGGDWPVCTLAASLKGWVTALRAVVASRPLAERKKLFHDNAMTIYRLA